jgi:hypothetical protein
LPWFSCYFDKLQNMDEWPGSNDNQGYLRDLLVNLTYPWLSLLPGHSSMFCNLSK